MISDHGCELDWTDHIFRASKAVLRLFPNDLDDTFRSAGRLLRTTVLIEESLPSISGQ